MIATLAEKSKTLTNHLLDHRNVYPKFSFKEAETVKESKQAQNLRYKIFKNELNVKTNLKGKIIKREFDQYDKNATHIIVKAKSTPLSMEKVVGVYRVIKYTSTDQLNDCYTSKSMCFDLELFKKNINYSNFLELGRTCILPEYRKSGVLKLLWKGLYKYIQKEKIDILLGCASFWTIEPDDVTSQLSYLKQNHLMDKNIMVTPDNNIKPSIDKLSVCKMYDSYNLHGMESKVFKSLPSLIKAYISVGSKFGDGAVIDYDFRSIDVFTYVDIHNIDDRVKKYYAK